MEMVQTKVIALAALVLLASSCEYRYSWEKYSMDGHRTGVTAPGAENVAAALGTVDGDAYTAPNGTAWQQGSATYGVAADLIAVQPQMKEIKKVVGFATRDMAAAAPESELSNWWVDRMMADVARLTKRPVDVGVLNFGGIRVPMPEGAVTLDDLSSMFPFVNYLAYAKVKGAGITKILEQLAGQDAFQAVSGVKAVVKNHKLESATVGGKPIDPKKVYNVATIDFLLDGGDQIAVGAVADKVVLSHELVKDIMIKHIKNLEAKGQLIECKSDGRVIMTEE